jgi:hypothetical protein
MRAICVGALAQRQHLRADGAGRVEPGERGDHQRHHVDAHAFAQGQRHDDQHHQVGYGSPILTAPRARLSTATVIGRDEGQRGTDETPMKPAISPILSVSRVPVVIGERLRPGDRCRAAPRTAAGHAGQRPGVGESPASCDDGEGGKMTRSRGKTGSDCCAGIEELRPCRLRQQPARRPVGEDGGVSRQGVDVSFSDRRCAGRAAGRRGRGLAWPGRWR